MQQQKEENWFCFKQPQKITLMKDVQLLKVIEKKGLTFKQSFVLQCSSLYNTFWALNA